MFVKLQNKRLESMELIEKLPTKPVAVFLCPHFYHLSGIFENENNVLIREECSRKVVSSNHRSFSNLGLQIQ